MSRGFIYILTNRSFKDSWVKIGYAKNVEQRVKQLNGTNLPFQYEIYAIYEVNSELSDKAIHRIIEELNPKLKLTPNREFFDVSPEKAYLLFENMAKIHNTLDKLKLFDNKTQTIEHTNKNFGQKRKKYELIHLGIVKGEKLVYIKNKNIVVEVIDDNKVEYQNQKYSLSGLAKHLNHTKSEQGQRYFLYKNKTILEIINEKLKSGELE